MATPILEIPINDEAFKQFLNLFNKMKADVAKLPEFWKDTNEEIISQASLTDSLITTIEKQTKALLEQQEVLHRHTQELEKQAKIEDKRERAETKERKDKEKADKKAIDDTKKIANNIAKATVNIVKWGALDFVVAGAADLWGLGAISRDVGGQLSAARGVNATIGQRQALSQTFQPIFDTANALENAAEAQTDITKSIPYRILGLNPNATNPAELSIDAAVAAKKRLQGYPQQSQLLVAGALGLDKVFSSDELRRLINTPLSFLEEEKTRYEKLQKVLDIPPKVAQEYTKLGQDLSIAGRDIEVYFAQKLIALGPGLDDLIHEFEGFAKHLIDLIDWKNLGTDVSQFAVKVQGFVQNIDWDRIKNDLEGMAIGMEKVLEFFHLLPEPSYKTGSPEWKAQKEKDAELNAIIAAGQASAAVMTGGASLGLPGMNPLGAIGAAGVDTMDLTGVHLDPISDKPEMQRAIAAYQRFRQLGWSSADATGMASYLSLESDLTNTPGDKNKFGRYTAQGMGQWHEQGQADYAKLFPGHTLGENTPGWFDRQLQLLSYELKQGDSIFARHLKDLLATNDPGEAGYLIRKYHGRGALQELDAKQGRMRAGQLAPVFSKVQVVVTHHLAPGANTTTSTALASQ